MYSARFELHARLLIRMQAPAYFIVAGLVFVAASEPYLQSEYGEDYQYDAPVMLLERMLHGLLDAPGTHWKTDTAYSSLARLFAAPVCVCI